jgi:hypothetical protein
MSADSSSLAPLRSRIMAEQDECRRELAALIVARVGSLRATGDPWEPYVLADPSGTAVQPVAIYLRGLQAAGRAETTLRSYGMVLLRWFRFCWAADVSWSQVTRVEARDFSRWIQIADKPAGSADGQSVTGRRPLSLAPSGLGGSGAPNPVTGKPAPGRKYAAATGAHSETVLRHFYDFHLEAGTGPIVNPFPLARGRAGGGGVNAHHNPMELHRNQRSGLFRPRLVQRLPRQIPDEKFDELFAALNSHRDRALVAFWVSTGARAEPVNLYEAPVRGCY